MVNVYLLTNTAPNTDQKEEFIKRTEKASQKLKNKNCFFYFYENYPNFIFLNPNEKRNYNLGYKYV